MSHPALPHPQASTRTEDRVLFRAACGMSRPWRLTVTAYASGGKVGDTRQVVLDSPYARIGRDPNAEIVLDHPDISRVHAVLLFIAGRPFVFDLGSRSGLVWPSGRGREGWLDDGNSLRIGPFLLAFQPESAESAGERPSWPEPTTWPHGCHHPLSSRPVAHDLLPALTIEFPDDRTGASIEWEMRSLITLVGRSPACKICIEHPGLSRFECVLIRTPLGPWAVDTLGRGGINLEGDRQTLLPLCDGVSFTLGDRRIVARLSPKRSDRPSAPSSRQLASRASTKAGSPALRPSVVDPLPTELVEQFGQMQSEVLEQVRQSLLTMGRWLGNVHREEMVQMRQELAELRAAVAKRDEAGRPAAVLGDHRTEARQIEPPRGRPARNGKGRQPAEETTPTTSPTVDDLAGDDLHTLLIDRIEQLQREQRSRWNWMLQRSKESNA